MLNEIDLSRIDLNLLVFFEAVLAETNVARAAAKLSLSPSAVSHGLRRLRDLFSDPLFLRTPKGVVPTERASELAPAIADVLLRTRNVIAMASPFDPRTSTRRFAIGTTDGVAVVILPALLAELARAAPGVDVAIVETLHDRAFELLDRRIVDVSIAPVEDVPARFATRPGYQEDFVIAMRAGHPLLRQTTLERYCAARHILVSNLGSTHGFIDAELAKRRLRRHVALAVPSFMQALSALPGSDLVCAIPRGLASVHAARFDVATVESPLPLPRWHLPAIVKAPALLDAGVAWLLGVLERVAGEASGAAPKKKNRAPRTRQR